MTLTVLLLIGAFVLWIAACALCGLRRRFTAFVAVLVTGLVLNLAWMMLGLEARPLEYHAVMAQAALLLHGLAAFGVGLLLSRLVSAWRDSAVDKRV